MCMHVCVMYSCMCVCMHVCVHACMHVVSAALNRYSFKLWDILLPGIVKCFIFGLSLYK